MGRWVNGPIGRSAKAWALVIGGMIAVGALNVFIAWKWFVPDDMDRHWDDPDAAVAAPRDAGPGPSPTAPR